MTARVIPLFVDEKDGAGRREEDKQPGLRLYDAII
jgi:hypothetical protein